MLNEILWAIGAAVIGVYMLIALLRPDKL